MQVIPEGRIRAVIGLDAAALSAVRGAFVALAEGRVRMPPVLHVDLPDVRGEMDLKTAVIAGMDHFCLKVSTGFFDNPARGLPSLGGMMLVLSARTGQIGALLVDNGYLTNIRTALAGAVAADALAAPAASMVAIIGSGVQARLQAQALMLVRDVQEFRIWARDADRAAACAQDIAVSTGRTAKVCATVRQACDGAAIIVTTTPARAPVLSLADVAPGAHVTAMGSDAPGKREVADDLLQGAAVVVVDDVAQSRALGELQNGAALRSSTTLGAVLTGVMPLRQNLPAGAITLCDLTGTGAQDTAIAAEALRRLNG
jgi:ornithine cyclodeaminase